MWSWSKWMDDLQWHWKISYSGRFSNCFRNVELSTNQKPCFKNHFENRFKLIDGQMNENEAEIQNLLDPNRFNKVPIWISYLTYVICITSMIQPKLSLRRWNKSPGHWQNWAPGNRTDFYKIYNPILHKRTLIQMNRDGILQLSLLFDYEFKT